MKVEPMRHSAEGCINHAHNESIRLGLPAGPINIFCNRFYWTWVDKRSKDFKNRKQWSSNPTSSRGDLSSWARKQSASCGGWKEQGDSISEKHPLQIISTPSGFAININFLPGNVVPFDSISVEVVQDSEADLEKRIVLKYLVTQWQW